METTVKERLIIYLAYKKIGQKKFADACGLSAGFVNAIKNSIQPKTIHSITIAYPDLNTGWLLTGEGEMLKEKKMVVSSPAPEYQNSKQEEIDRLNRLVSSQQDTISKLTELLYERKGVRRDAEVAGVG